MTEDDDLSRLKAHLRAAPPQPDPDARAAALAAAMASFDWQAEAAATAPEEILSAPQESAAPPRPNSDRPKRSGWLGGVLDMLKNLSLAPTLKGALAGGTALAALAVAVVALGPQLREGPMGFDIADSGEQGAEVMQGDPMAAAVPSPTTRTMPVPAPAPAPERAEAKVSAEAAAEPVADMAEAEAFATAEAPAADMAAPAPLTRSRKAVGLAAPTASGGFVPQMEAPPARYRSLRPC